mgnify:CR=1 FL=1
MEEYRVGRRIGEGAFGEVVEAVHVATGREVAIKQLFVRAASSRERVPDVAREVAVTRALAHNHIVATQCVLERGRTVWIVMERAATDLASLLGALRQPLPEGCQRALFVQLVSALAYMHDVAGVMHRDVKPGNVMLTHDACVKLGDFGLARPLLSPVASCGSGGGDSSDVAPATAAAPGAYSNQVGSRWYRAPELLYGADVYGPPVDMWAAGCILAELAELSPLFPGRTDIDQIRVLHQVLGSPSTATWPVRN